MLEAVITQNIDTLHRKRRVAAGGRGARHDRDRVVLAVQGELPARATSSRCSTTTASRAARAAGPVKPDVVLFGEMLPEQAMLEAHALCAACRPAAVRRHLARGLSRRGAAERHPRARAARSRSSPRGPRPTTRRPRCASTATSWTSWRRCCACCEPRSRRAERDVAASPRGVFAYLADLEQHWQLADRFIEVRELERPPGGGPARGGVVRMRGPLGIRRAARTRVVEAEPPTRLAGSAAVGSGTIARSELDALPDG